MLTTVNICGRHYILRAEIARFNERAAAGEFAKRSNKIAAFSMTQIFNVSC